MLSPFSSASTKPGLSSIDTMELARVYDKLTTEDCFRRDTMVKYHETLETMLSQCQETTHPKTQGKGRAEVFSFYSITKLEMKKCN